MHYLKSKKITRPEICEAELKRSVMDSGYSLRAICQCILQLQFLLKIDCIIFHDLKLPLCYFSIYDVWLVHSLVSSYSCVYFYYFFYDYICPLRKKTGIPFFKKLIDEHLMSLLVSFEILKEVSSSSK